MQIGFTFIETMVVMTILALLATIVIPVFQNSLLRNKVQKTADLIANTINMAQSEALRRNIRIYVSVVGEDLCIGITPRNCDLRKTHITDNVSVTASVLALSPFYGSPTPAPAAFNISYSGLTQTVNVNRLGIVTVGEAQ